MASDTHDFGVVDRLQAAAVGLPGQRTFRLQFLNDEHATASLWLEKEQLQALGSAISRLMAQLSGEEFVDLVTRGAQATEAELDPRFPEPPDVEFKIGQLALAYDEEQKRFTVLVHDIESEEQRVATFRCMVTRDQLEALSRQIESVVNQGRPRCPLCGAPLTAGSAHFCPPSNGHTPVQLEE
jgi:uncharacterized repeat protein (TIGR03847 family)